MAHSFGKVSCKEHPPCSAHSGDSKSGLHVSNNMVVWASLVRDATRLLSLKSVGSQLGQSRCLSFFLLSVLLCSWRMISEVLCQRMMVSILWGVYWHQPDVVACNCSCSHICWGCQCIFLCSFQWLLWVLWHTHELSSLVPTLKTFIFKLMCMYMSTVVHGFQGRALHPLKLELHVLANHQQVLGTELGSSRRALHVLSYWLISFHLPSIVLPFLMNGGNLTWFSFFAFWGTQGMGVLEIIPGSHTCLVKWYTPPRF